jgi:hypothetical protein
VLGEECAVDAPTRGFVGHGLGAVLAEFEEMAVGIRARPGAGLAIEAIELVDLQQRGRAGEYPG